MRQIHVTQRKDGNWQAKQPDNDRTSVVRPTKAETIEAAKQIAKNQGLELIPHNRDGKISNPNSYGKDPCPPKDKKF
jgi:hypothetical protein